MPLLFNLWESWKLGCVNIVLYSAFSYIYIPRDRYTIVKVSYTLFSLPPDILHTQCIVVVVVVSLSSLMQRNKLDPFCNYDPTFIKKKKKKEKLFFFTFNILKFLIYEKRKETTKKETNIQKKVQCRWF